MKKRVAIVAMALAFPGEKGPERFYYIANYLFQHGYDVKLITSTYQHWEKRQRKEEKIDSEVPFSLAYQPSYNKNVSISRMAGYLWFGKNVIKQLSKYNCDYIYCSIPDNYTAHLVMKYAKSQKIKSILDVEDLWPEGMMMALGKHRLGKVLFPMLSIFRIYAKSAYKNANAYIGTSNEYTRYGVRYDRINSSKIAKTVYVGNDLRRFDIAAETNNAAINKSSFWVMYAGSIGASYDIKTLVDAAIALKKRGYDDIEFLVLGDGDMRKELEGYAKSNLCNVRFLGYVQYELMAAYLKRADIVVNSFVKNAPQSIVTKIGDYLASGNPMINTCESKEMCRLVDHNHVGINVEAENRNELIESILVLYKSDELRHEYGQNARKLAENEFDRKVAYHKIIDVLEAL